MSRDLAMGLWTGLLAGLVSAPILLVLDLATGAGLDASAGLARALGLPSGVSLAVLAGGATGLLLALLPALVLALLPPRLAGAGVGLLVGVAAALALLLPAGAREASRAPLLFLVSAACGGALAGFLYSRYARTRLRSPGSRPFARR